MKKIFIFFFTALLLTSSTNIFSQIFEENFEYPCGDSISNHGWVTISGFGVNPIKVCCPGLEYPCYAGSAFGNAACLKSTGEDSYKFFTRSVDSGSVYVVFMVNFDTAQDGEYFFHLSDSNTNNNERNGRIYARDSSGKIALGLAKDNEDPTYTPAKYLRHVTYLLILKYSFIPGNDNDLVRLYVYAAPECPPCVEPSTPTLGPLGAGEDDLTNAARVVLQQGAGGHGATLALGGIYVNTFWDCGALPVEMSAFNSGVSRRDVTLNWTTISETNNSGFNVERKLVGSNDWNVIGNVTGNGTSSISHHYVYSDKNLSSGIYNYRLKQIDLNGNFEYFNLTSEVVIGVPIKFELSQNYPNPFNPSTKIDYDLPRDGFVKISVFDLTGKEVASLVNGNVTAGYHTANFNASNLSSGIYYYKLETAGFTKVMKMALVK